MFTVYETAPRYRRDGSVAGYRHRSLATVATRAEAREVATKWADNDTGDRGVVVWDATGRPTSWFDPR